VSEQRVRDGAMIAFVGAFFVVWTLWCVLLVQYPQPLTDGRIRALARLGLWMIPTLGFVALRGRESVAVQLRLRPGVGRGIAWGLAAALLHPVSVAAWRLGSGAATFAIPDDEATWLNPILGAPLAEELLFRGVVLGGLATRWGAPRALVASAVLFSLAHLPYWWLSGQPSGWSLVAAETTMVLYGLAFGALYLASRSLWAPLIYHVINNFLSIAVTDLPGDGP
jgi:membrane protease YdiL (CAAX protease family)